MNTSGGLGLPEPKNSTLTLVIFPNTKNPKPKNFKMSKPKNLETIKTRRQKLVKNCRFLSSKPKKPENPT